MFAMQTSTRQVLVTVKTYPVPSQKYDELVCTAGVDLTTGQFIRLLPIRFRGLPFAQQFKKWSVIEAEMFRRTQDARGDTYTPIENTLSVVSPPMDTKDGWKSRGEVVLPLVSNIEDLTRRAEQRQGSLGFVK